MNHISINDFLNLHSLPGSGAGIYYFNPRDPRLIVRKFKPSLGCYFTFAGPYSHIILASIILITVAAIAFLK